MIKLFEKDAYDYTTNGIGVLSDAETCVVRNSLNDEFTLELKYPTTGVLYSEIKKNRIVVTNVNMVDGIQPFRIKNISTPIRGSITVTAYHLVYDLVDYLVPAIEELDNTTNAMNTLGAILDACGSVMGETKQTITNGYSFGNFEFDVSEINKDQEGQVYRYDGVVNLTDGVKVYDRKPSWLIEEKVIATLDNGYEVQMDTTSSSEASKDDPSLANKIKDIFTKYQAIEFLNPDDPSEEMSGYVPKGSVSQVHNDEYVDGYTLLKLDKPSNLKSLLGTYINEQDRWKTNRQSFKSFIESFNCDVKFSYNSTSHRINIKFVPQLGIDTSIMFRYGVNLKDMKQTENVDSMYTHIYPYYGSGDDIITLDSEGQFSEPTIPITKLQDGEYVEMEEILGRRRVLPLDLSSEFYDSTGEKLEPSTSELYGRTVYYIDYNRDVLTEPELSLEVQYAQLSKSPEYETFKDFDKINLGDFITVIHPDLDIKIRVRVKQIEFDSILMQYKNITIGDRPKKLTRMFLVNDIKEQDNRRNNLLTNELGIVKTQTIYYLSTEKDPEIPVSPKNEFGKDVWVTNEEDVTDAWTTKLPEIRTSMTPAIASGYPIITSPSASGFAIDPFSFNESTWLQALISQEKAKVLTYHNGWSFSDGTSANTFMNRYRSYFTGTPGDGDTLVTKITGQDLTYYSCDQKQKIDGRVLNGNVIIMADYNESVKNTIVYSENIFYLSKNGLTVPSKPTTWVQYNAPATGDHSNTWYRSTPVYVANSGYISVYYRAQQTRYLDGSISFTDPIADYQLNAAYSGLDETVVAAHTIYCYTTEQYPVPQAYPTTWTTAEISLASDHGKWGISMPNVDVLTDDQLANLTLYMAMEYKHKDGTISHSPEDEYDSVVENPVAEIQKIRGIVNTVAEVKELAEDAVIGTQNIFYKQSTQVADVAPALPSGWVTNVQETTGEWMNHIPAPVTNIRIWTAIQVKLNKKDSSGNNVVTTSPAVHASMDNLILSWVVGADQLYIDGSNLYAGSVTAARAHVVVPDPDHPAETKTIFDANGLTATQSPYVQIGNYIVNAITGGLIGDFDADDTPGIVIRRKFTTNTQQAVSVEPGYFNISNNYGGTARTLQLKTTNGSGDPVIIQGTNGINLHATATEVTNPSVNFTNGGITFANGNTMNTIIVRDSVPTTAGKVGQIVFVKASQ